MENEGSSTFVIRRICKDCERVIGIPSDSEINKHNCVPVDKIQGIKLADYISVHLPLNQDT